ncbi:acyl-CoA dehydrogenase family protein [Streptomyces tsukubensis]|uniref:Acyl-CoA dehydrogenase n=1 Tax=Streptomyces tsukubensis (strain DSM 42081 / NBRC 108919 / NRRL 18488 / 9993) TaxID=1114943 RepID=A0A7G3UAQ7_STRT9|nr:MULTISPECIES: acyl-CoA dehydrogenase family protein [Streptomyces]AZK97632.1 acyl-CoA dehydrogenase [Streptomyces tsukubensis]MYS66153.1 flavin-dependent monooxygenase [Streptomyces sp. SID5473]QKM66429.1 acyl-CoA dehydrogenase [Streptomyces tsukubensis NRRL18488]TAI45232.1 flavin-dependent monooxygenase [Streptomyces tsukubensis]
MAGSSASRTETDLLDRVRALHPLIRSHTASAERQRRVTREVVEALGDAGILRMNVPRHYGGYQSSLRTQVDVLSEISAACGSAGYLALSQAGSAFIAALFPDEVQDEIFTGPDVRISSTLVPGSKAVPVDGGYTVNGKSPFASGCQDADWHLLTALDDTGEGPPELLWLAIPMTELAILDDWDFSGLTGSGSNTVVARDVQVPAHRALRVGPLLEGECPSQRNSADPFYRMPVILMFCAWTAASAVGLARGALAEFGERIQQRGITYTFYQHQHEAPVTHLQFAEAEMKVSAAELLSGDLVQVIESRAAAGEPYTTAERARIRAQCGYAARLCKEAGDLVGSASGASSLHREVPVQRMVRDLNALNLHSFVNPAANLELYGRVLSGLEPDTPFL